MWYVCRYNFQLKDEGTHFTVEVECPRYMETSLIECDVQPTYVRANIKSKILQLVLSDEISPDASSAKRSQATGHLLLELPKVKPTLSPAAPIAPASTKKEVQGSVGKSGKESSHSIKRELRNGHGLEHKKLNVAKKQNEKPFQDDPDVPPLI